MKKARNKFLILIAEDNIVSLKMMLLMLQDSGYQVKSVNNGMDAVAFLKQETASLVLMDVHMPDMDGFTATGEIRKLQGPVHKLPIIAITAHALPGDREKCLQAGMNDYISKPFTAELLIQKIDECLGINNNISEPLAQNNSSQNIIDVEYLDNISLGNKEFLQDLLLTYIEDMETRLNGLTAALGTKDIKKVVLEAHSIKGASLSVGLKKVGEEAMAIELSGKEDDLESARIRIPSLTRAFKEAKQHILDFLD